MDDEVVFTVEQVHDALWAVYLDYEGGRVAMNVESDDEATVEAAMQELTERYRNLP